MQLSVFIIFSIAGPSLTRLSNFLVPYHQASRCTSPGFLLDAVSGTGGLALFGDGERGVDVGRRGDAGRLWQRVFRAIALLPR